MPSATRFLLLISPLRHKFLTQHSLTLLTRHHNNLHLTRRSLHSHPRAAASTNSDPTFSPLETHRFPAWSSFINALSSQNYFSQAPENEFTAPDNANFPEEFDSCVNACLAFARHRASILRLLPRGDVEVVVENVRPVLFRNGEDSVRRLRGFLGSGIDSDEAGMIDLMRLLLSYVSNPVGSLEKTDCLNSDLLEASIHNLLNELDKQSRVASSPEFTGSVQNQFPDGYGRPPRQFGPNIEMKKGDWICTRCSFMNFARNMKCLECEEVRPRGQLTGGEWECAQCGFFNFGKNMACVRCDCKRTGDSSLSSTNVTVGPGYRNGSTTDKTDLGRRLADDEEKAQRWFSKISQLDSTSEIGSEIADEDFPDIIPLRKGVNRFVVSSRKTPLERRLANATYRRSLGNDGSPEVDVPTEGANRTSETKISQTLNEILGRRPGDADRTNEMLSSSSSPQHDGGSSSTQHEKQEGNVNRPIDRSNEASIVRKASQYSENLVRRADNYDVKKHYGKPEGWLDETVLVRGVEDMPSCRSDHVTATMPIREGENLSVVDKHKDLPPASPMYKRHNAMEKNGNSSFVPFVPFPPGYFARKDKQPPVNTHLTGKASDGTSHLAVNEKPLDTFNCAAPATREGRNMQMVKRADNYDMKKQDGKPEGWLDETARVHGVKDMPSYKSDHVTETMPIREGENLSVVGKQKDLPPASPMYKRHNAMEQTGNSSFVPFVPFPPGYFARKDKQPPVNTHLTGKASNGTSHLAVNRKPLDTFNGAAPAMSEGRNMQMGDHQHQSTGVWNSRGNPNKSEFTSSYEKQSTGSLSSNSNYQVDRNSHLKDEPPLGNINERRNLRSSSPQPSENQNLTGSWTGKSLEGSAVKEPDPLDMSEEAKAERWFRRVAQIKDISELSLIPDEDFPSIMPMRKGVNKFVVSKRKTPLERRLTSSQYKKTLPVVRSDSFKTECDSNESENY